MERCAVFEKSRFQEFFDLMQEFGEVFAPRRVSEKSFSFKQVNKPSEIAFEALRTILPPKKFFFQQRETIIAYDETGVREVKPAVSKQVSSKGIFFLNLVGLNEVTICGDQRFNYHHRQQNFLNDNRQLKRPRHSPADDL